MKKSLPLILVAVLSFIAGLTLNLSGYAQKKQAPDQTPPTAQLPVPSPCPEEDLNVIEDQHVTKFNGKRLNLDYTSGVQEVDVPHAIDNAEVTPLEDGGLLVDLGDTLYRLDKRLHVQWRFHTAQIIFDYAYVKQTNLVYGTAGDNVMFVLDAATGKELTGETRNGSAWYGVAEKYGDDMCLVTDYFRWYRERDWKTNMEPMKDGVSCWRGTQKLWHLDLPPDGKLAISGNRILAVTKSKKAIYVNEIIPPTTRK